MEKGRTITAAAVFASALLTAFALSGSVSTAADTTCSTANTLSGSNFEIDVDANLKVDGAGSCIDWLADGTGSAMRSGVLAKNDKPSGSGDDSFGKGTSEDDANPTIVSGSIPPNKSDLKVFGVYNEIGTPTTANPSGKFLELFWSRVQNPSGTTNMDFELNQKFCDPSATPTNCANNGSGVTPETPARTTGDKLVTYDLSKGGTVPTISIRTWGGSAWGPATVISGGANAAALGSVNTSTILASDAGGIGSEDPYTFGEAAISFSALFTGGTTCGSFGSTYLKSRSSDSFSAELKDFIAPEKVTISNCPTLTTSATASVTIGDPISDAATLSGATANAGGSITFKLYSDATCSTLVTTLGPVSVSGNGNYGSGNYTPTAVGTYYWTATYSGDAGNASVSTSCGDAGASSVVNKKQPSLSTSATRSVSIGSPISDTATLSNATSDASGTITFKLYSDATCSTLVTTLTNSSVSGNGSYGSGNYTPTATGTYYWVASYGGDAKNLSASTSCGDLGESTVVVKLQPSLSTSATASATIDSPISDTATLSGATSDASGTITFRLYSDSTCLNLVTTLTNSSVNGNGDYGSGNYTPTAVGTYYWTASYSGDAKNLPAATLCGDVGETSVVNKAPSNISTAQQIFPQDSATISASAGGTPSGTVHFKLFGPDNPTCDPNGAAPKYTEDVSLSSGSAATSNKTFHVDSASASTYKWLIVYDGDTNHDGVTSACGTEQFTLTIANS